MAFAVPDIDIHDFIILFQRRSFYGPRSDNSCIINLFKETIK